MKELERAYATKDVEMLIAIDIIVDAAIANKDFLQTKRSTWEDPYFEDIKEQIDTVVQTRLGVDNASQLRESTQAVNAIHVNAYKDLAEIKVQIAVDFADQSVRKTEILNKLGFISHFTAAAKNQEALINLLFQYKTSLTTELKAEIVAKGTAEETLEKAITHADALREANVTQEGNKGRRKAVTAEDIAAFNEVYTKVIGIAKIASNFYKGNPAMQEQFSFGKITRGLKNAPAARKRAVPVE